jgi:hypothetical protein
MIDRSFSRLRVWMLDGKAETDRRKLSVASGQSLGASLLRTDSIPIAAPDGYCGPVDHFRSCTKPQAPKPQDDQIASAIRRGGLSTLLSPRLVQAEMAAVPGRRVSIVWGRMGFVPGQGVAHVRPRRAWDRAGINPSSRRSTAAVHTHSRPSIFSSSLVLSSGLALLPLPSPPLSAAP